MSTPKNGLNTSKLWRSALDLTQLLPVNGHKIERDRLRMVLVQEKSEHRPELLEVLWPTGKTAESRFQPPRPKMVPVVDRITGKSATT